MAHRTGGGGVATTALRVAVSLALAFSLASCSQIGPGSGPAPEPTAEQEATQTPNPGSGADGCALASQRAEELSSDLRDRVPDIVNSALTGEAPDLSGIFAEAGSTLDAAAAGASDPAVSAAIADARAEWDGLASDLAGLGALDLAGADLATRAERTVDYGSRLTEILGERAPALQRIGEELKAACAAQ
ncbi:hypothetical protein [Leucobacter luti]|uniref:hypothetical protein n=1 Tax=Leucobacter luti TaxID=340320 RepID=UPI003D08E75E